MYNIMYMYQEMCTKVLFYTLIFCRVAQQESTNKMNPYNLAVIFAPCLFQAESKSKNPQDVLKDLAKQTM